MLTPTGFLSYARSDDKNSGGVISDFQRKLLAEMQLKIGKQPIVEIFQDRERIGSGAAWERSIRDAIGSANFLIPILTPAFLQSEWCCRELLMFRQRLGDSERRHPLIFPIHFVEIDLDREDFDRPTLEFLKSLQWVDLRGTHLRGLDRTELAALAKEIHAALSGAEPLVFLPPPRAARATPGTAAGSEIGADGASPGGPADVSRPTAPTKPPRHWRRWVAGSACAALACGVALYAALPVVHELLDGPSAPVWAALPSGTDLANRTDESIEVLDRPDPGAGIIANVLPHGRIPHDPGTDVTHATIGRTPWIRLTYRGRLGYVPEAEVALPKPS